mmetsp:Transcript_23138/g.87567  ORF Transcript_23138/g.87567 Transcript_23138/m.87567 type:complete len:245 (-) Transcript_23138:149-883(-)
MAATQATNRPAVGKNPALWRVTAKLWLRTRNRSSSCRCCVVACSSLAHPSSPIASVRLGSVLAHGLLALLHGPGIRALPARHHDTEHDPAGSQHTRESVEGCPVLLRGKVELEQAPPEQAHASVEDEEEGQDDEEVTKAVAAAENLVAGLQPGPSGALDAVLDLGKRCVLVAELGEASVQGVVGVLHGSGLGGCLLGGRLAACGRGASSAGGGGGGVLDLGGHVRGVNPGNGLACNCLGVGHGC